METVIEYKTPSGTTLDRDSTIAWLESCLDAAVRALVFDVRSQGSRDEAVGWIGENLCRLEEVLKLRAAIGSLKYNLETGVEREYVERVVMYKVGSETLTREDAIVELDVQRTRLIGTLTDEVHARTRSYILEWFAENADRLATLRDMQVEIDAIKNDEVIL